MRALESQLSLESRNRGNEVAENFLQNILERSLDHVDDPVLDEVADQVDDDFEDPVERSEAVDVDADVTDVGDLEHVQLNKKPKSDFSRIFVKLKTNRFHFKVELK